MRKIQVTDEFMTELASRFDKARLEALPEPADCGEGFSPEFREKLIRHAKRRQTLIAFGRRAAAAVIALVMGAAILFAASPDVRAAVKGWFREVFGTTVLYRFTDNAEITELPDYEPFYIPEGFEEVDRLEERNIIFVLYINPETEDVIQFECHLLTDGMNIQINYDNNLYHEKVKIYNLSGDYYAADETSQTNTLVWFDETGQVVFILNSNLEKDVILHIAEGVALEDPTK